MQAYELCALFSGNNTEEEVEQFSGEIVSLLESLNIAPKHTQSLGRRKLAYPIMGNTHGSYRVWLFESEPENIEEINKKLRLNSNVVRHLVVTLETGAIEKRIERAKEEKYSHLKREEDTPEDTEQKEQETKTAPAPKPAKEEAPEPKKTDTGEKPSIEELDEKLDELLESDKI